MSNKGLMGPKKLYSTARSSKPALAGGGSVICADYMYIAFGRRRFASIGAAICAPNHFFQVGGGRCAMQVGNIRRTTLALIGKNFRAGEGKGKEGTRAETHHDDVLRGHEAAQSGPRVQRGRNKTAAPKGIYGIYGTRMYIYINVYAHTCV